MTERPHSHLYNADLRALAQEKAQDLRALHVIYAELLFRKKKEAVELRELLRRILAAQSQYYSWPSTEVTAGDGTLDSGYFQYQQGLLGYVGYQVGAKGVSFYRRRALLDDVFQNSLPRLNSAEYMKAWGMPKSPKRLHKLAESIAAFARNAKHNDAGKYALAIADWESDLRYLKATYYNSLCKFPWPDTSI
jgi:hypothetical protein